jgi:hypothetical protein
MRVGRDITQTLRLEMKELGEIDMALVAAIGTRLLVPRDVAPEFVPRGWQASQDAARDWRSSPCTGSVDISGQLSAMARPATAVQRRHECGTGGRLQAPAASLSSGTTRRNAAPAARAFACSTNVSGPRNCGTTSADQR